MILVDNVSKKFYKEVNDSDVLSMIRDDCSNVRHVCIYRASELSSLLQISWGLVESGYRRLNNFIYEKTKEISERDIDNVSVDESFDSSFLFIYHKYLDLIKKEIHSGHLLDPKWIYLSTMENVSLVEEYPRYR